MVSAIQDKESDLTHVAMYWEDDLDMWKLLALGRSQEEILDRVKYWKNKGTENIKVYNLSEI